ncbi:hypothetical protein PC116_g15786 [Phytophthora cactorum]|uniref:Uncharacterized protein n=1 Tax=Phytophthora cactorum TaxID=29920 RepID=A0A8T1KKM9_9STRA|nr:hypothetical protein PC117_g25057 [Phytophthora cactorum]KAG2902651.1 hypothetical protein PC114_g12634 [Phytophthora cactorum]KAG2967049.1 hypothetical protein PC119_g24575 [Phytophthora cactorum]KAG3017749.1 hypothetical protein PC120_g10851 [Phytophthora cactorum]KAG3149264.1 hypothetical protein C6341_g17124 [Phytophthora cactorum]
MLANKWVFSVLLDTRGSLVHARVCGFSQKLIDWAFMTTQLAHLSSESLLSSLRNPVIAGCRVPFGFVTFS